MLVTTFEEDLIGLREFSQRLLRFIDVEHHFVDGSLVIGLSSKYGSGKTTFFRMLKDDLEKGESVIGPVTVVRNQSQRHRVEAGGEGPEVDAARKRQEFE